ncbi:MAG: adenosine deaminase [Candidatus Acidiferrales bacterium]
MKADSTAGVGRHPTVVDALPKAEIHLHLEGSIRPKTAVELAARHGEKITVEEVARHYQYADFAGFIEAFKWVTSYLREPDDYRVIVNGLAEELIQQNVVYAEITISAGVMRLREQDIEANFAAICDAAGNFASRGLRVAWIFDAARQFGAAAATEVALIATKLRNGGVVAFGMGGDELAFPASDFRAAFDHSRSKGLRIVCHAGETGGPQSVRDAIETLGAERIGHGIGVMHDDRLAETCAERGIVLENCITSNLCTGALAKQTGNHRPALADHPLRGFLNRGVPVALSTDDPAMFHTDLLTEYSKVTSLGLSDAQLVALAEQSFHAAFLPAPEKKAYVQQFRAAMEARPLV